MLLERVVESSWSLLISAFFHKRIFLIGWTAVFSEINRNTGLCDNRMFMFGQGSIWVEVVGRGVTGDVGLDLVLVFSSARKKAAELF